MEMSQGELLKSKDQICIGIYHMLLVACSQPNIKHVSNFKITVLK